MARPSKTDQEMGYVKDWWTEARTIESLHHGTVQMSLWPTNRPGVFQVSMSFTPLMSGQENGLGVCSLSFAYPNAEQSTMAGFLWRKCIALGRMVEETEEIYKAHRKKES